MFITGFFLRFRVQITGNSYADGLPQPSALIKAHAQFCEEM